MGKSHPMVNVVWGLISVVVGLILLAYAPVTVGPSGGFVAMVLGALASGIFAANHFYRWRQSNVQRPYDPRSE